MNLEDRLRSHMHSGDDLFIETGRDAGAIAAAGRRRTRRNQIGGAAAGGVLALGLVFGIASQTGSDSPEEFANPEREMAESEMDLSAMADDDGEMLPGDSEMADTEVAPSFVAHEVIVGVDDGFVGLRTTEDGIVAIRSGDGIEWSEEATTGIPPGADIASIVEDDGVFAAPVTVYDERTATSTSYIGTSTDLLTWTVEPIDVGDEFLDVFVGGVVMTNGDVLAVISASPPFDDASEGLVEVAEPSIFAIRGPTGGPYASTLLDAVGFASDLEAADGTAMFIVSGIDGAQVWASTGGGWAMIRESSFEEYPILGTGGTTIYLATSHTVEGSDDGGLSWSEVEVSPEVEETGVSAVVVSGGENVAVLFNLVADDGRVGYELFAGSNGAVREVSLDGLVPEGAYVNAVAVSADEALLEVFPEPEVADPDLAASSELVDDVTADAAPRYVRVPLS